LASCPTLYNSNTGTCVNSGTLLLKYNFYQFDSVFTDAENLLSFTGTNVQFGAFRGSLITSVSETQEIQFAPFFSVSL
jgi:hypothetical protein